MRTPMKPPSFPAFAICGLDELIGHQGRGVTHILSILDPEWPDPEAFQAYDPHVRATLRFHDAIEPGPDILLPQRADVEAILTFGRDAAEAGGLLIHCHAGISRSTAATLMILAQAHPHEGEDELADRLLQTRPQAWPNSRMITFADELLDRNGRLMAATTGIYAAATRETPGAWRDHASAESRSRSRTWPERKPSRPIETSALSEGSNGAPVGR